MAELPTDILTDAGFTAEEAEAVVQGLVQGIDLHRDPINIDELPPVKKDALERFTMAVAADG
jgi:hypothetical protein